MSSQNEELKGILNQILSLLKIANKKTLDEARSKIQGDKTAAKILELCSQPISYMELAKQVAVQTGVAEITVRRRISELKESGILVTNRRGKEVFYTDSGLIS
jgi:DNA-binding transcriptional ArsR family regulator